MPTMRLRRLMESTTGILLCLLIFIVRASITLWSKVGSMSKAYCAAAILACVTGILTNFFASKLALPRSSN